jgi:hypothetical protein
LENFGQKEIDSKGYPFQIAAPLNYTPQADVVISAKKVSPAGTVLENKKSLPYYRNTLQANFFIGVNLRKI